MKQKVFSRRDRFFVKDENGNDRYAVEGEIAIGKRLHIYDADGNKSAFIRQKVMSWLPRYFVYINGQEVCTVVKEFTLFRQSYRVEGLSWHLTGNFLTHEYILAENGRQIMNLSKKWFTLGDSYELNITDPKNELLCLCVTLVVDCALAGLNTSFAGS